MSYSTIWKIYRTKATPYQELKNGHGSAPPIWNWLGMNYLGWGDHEWLMNKLQPLWELASNLSVPRHMRFALMATFDNGMVATDDLLEASELALRAYDTVFNPKYVNHWQEISKAYQCINERHDFRMVGVAIGCTSVNDPWWKFESRRPFNIIKSLNRNE